jgi:hypothetical protein
VAELDAVHQVMYPLWHDAFAAKDAATITELVPQFEPLLADLQAVELPGILRHKEEAWDDGVREVMGSYESLQQAVEAEDLDAMLQHTEEFHRRYEGLVRLIRPLVPELEAFHTDLYRVYHYYLPEWDMESLREAAVAMKAKMEPLAEAELPERLQDRRETFSAAVTALGAAVDGLTEALADGDRETVRAAVERVHTAYGEVEEVFDQG